MKRGWGPGVLVQRNVLRIISNFTVFGDDSVRGILACLYNKGLSLRSSGSEAFSLGPDGVEDFIRLGIDELNDGIFDIKSQFAELAQDGGL